MRDGAAQSPAAEADEDETDEVCRGPSRFLHTHLKGLRGETKPVSETSQQAESELAAAPSVSVEKLLSFCRSV